MIRGSRLASEHFDVGSPEHAAVFDLRKGLIKRLRSSSSRDQTVAKMRIEDVFAKAAQPGAGRAFPGSRAANAKLHEAQSSRSLVRAANPAFA